MPFPPQQMNGNPVGSDAHPETTPSISGTLLRSADCLPNVSSTHRNASPHRFAPSCRDCSSVPVAPSLPALPQPTEQNQEIDLLKYPHRTSNTGAGIVFSVEGSGGGAIRRCRGQIQLPIKAGLRPPSGPLSCLSLFHSCASTHRTAAGKIDPQRLRLAPWNLSAFSSPGGSSVSADSEAGVALTICKFSSLCFRHFLLLSPGLPYSWHPSSSCPQVPLHLMQVQTSRERRDLPTSPMCFPWSLLRCPAASHLYLLTDTFTSTLGIPPLAALTAPLDSLSRATSSSPSLPPYTESYQSLDLASVSFLHQIPSYSSIVCSKGIAFLFKSLWNLYEKSINRTNESLSLDFLFISLILLFYANIILSWLLQHLVIVVQSLSRVWIP